MTKQTELDEQLRKLVLQPFTLQIEKADLAKAITSANEHDPIGRTGQHRSKAKLQADALMKLPERQFLLAGCTEAEDYGDVVDAGSSLFSGGKIEVKTIAEGRAPDSVPISGQTFDYQVIYERVGFSTEELTMVIEETGLNSLLGLELRFKPVMVYRKPYNQPKEPYITWPMVRDLGEWPGTDTPSDSS